MISRGIRRVITISDKIDVGPLDSLKKSYVFWEQCIGRSTIVKAQ